MHIITKCSTFAYGLANDIRILKTTINFFSNSTVLISNMSNKYFDADTSAGNEFNGVYDGPVLHERLYRKVKQDNMNEHHTLRRREKLIRKEVRFVKSKISMEKKQLVDKTIMTAARVRKLEQEDNLIKGKGRKHQAPSGPPHAERRARRKQVNRFSQFTKQKNEESNDRSDSDDNNESKAEIRPPPPFLPPLYRQKALFPQRQWDKERKQEPVKVEDLYDCRYLRLSERQQTNRDAK